MDVRFAGALLVTGTGGLREVEELATLDEREGVARALDGADAGRGEGVVTPFFAAGTLFFFAGATLFFLGAAAAAAAATAAAAAAATAAGGGV